MGKKNRRGFDMEYQTIVCHKRSNRHSGKTNKYLAAVNVTEIDSPRQVCIMKIDVILTTYRVKLMASSNNNKGASTSSPIIALNQLQSELYELREKHIHALEIALAALEKEEDKQKAVLDKTRAQLKQYQDRLKDPKNAKPSAQGRLKASLASAQRNFDSDQATLAQLRGNIIEQRLALRKEKAVLKAMLETDRSLRKTSNKPAAKASPAKQVAAPVPKTPAPAKAKIAAAKPAAAPKAKPQAAAKPKPEEPKSPPTTAETGAMPAIKAELAKITLETAQDKTSVKLPKPKRRVRRMSDIPSHPDKAADRLASLFDDF
ncbi:MAG: putative coiled-coil protein SlyX [Zhongshania aliphaticivorans]|jgi:uncharacterized coiled-coil protein SlyX